jgi:hypothetical protein
MANGSEHTGPRVRAILLEVGRSGIGLSGVEASGIENRQYTKRAREEQWAVVDCFSAMPGGGFLYVGYETRRTSTSTNRQLRKTVKKASDVFLATDPRGDVAKRASSERK